MGYFITDPVGLIIAFLNVATFLLMVYLFLTAAGGQGRVFRALDRVFDFLLAPLRRLLPEWRLDPASIILIVVLQLIAFAIKRNWR